jgi:hypothetical protein
MTTLKIAGGELTTENALSSYGQPVFVFEGVAYGMADGIDLGEQALDFLRYPTAMDHVSTYHLCNTAECAQLPIDQYNMLAKFIGLPLAHD